MDKLIEKCRSIIKCDTARISKPCNKMFLIIGFNKNTKDDTTGVYVKDGKPYHFNYVEEKVVASGYTPDELIESCEHYVKIQEMTMEDYIFSKEFKK